MLKNSRVGIAVFVAPVIAGLLLFISGPGLSWSQPSKVPAGAESLFQGNCAICHGADGAGSPLGKNLHAPDLRSKPVQSQSDATLAKFIHDGGGAMPPFGSKLSSAQISNLVKYVRHLGASSKGK